MPTTGRMGATPMRTERPRVQCALTRHQIEGSLQRIFFRSSQVGTAGK